jgi:hypothetical protein
VIQVRTMTVDMLRSNVTYNLPNDSDIVLSPIVSGVRPDGSSGDVPSGVLVMNTGGSMNVTTVPPPANPGGTCYAENSSGTPSAPLTRLRSVTLKNKQELLRSSISDQAILTSRKPPLAR